ncbi:hypothetical protein, partial [Pseudomonas syringae group genomosp. 7]|uniref:hypothetical protein n=1 Tax=Pseudomonas syringae group genomosp. 7 TaxID=251699 RepID=UPI00376F83E1
GVVVWVVCCFGVGGCVFCCVCGFGCFGFWGCVCFGFWVLGWLVGGCCCFLCVGVWGGVGVCWLGGVGWCVGWWWWGWCVV